METKIKHPISGQPVDVAKIVLTDDNATGHELYAINYGSQPVYRKTIAINVDNVHGYESFEHNAQYCEPLTIALIPLDGYQALPWNTKVTMDGEDVTSAVFDVATNSINITEVTGDISIEAEAVEMSSDYEPVEYIHVDTATSNSIITLWGCMANSNSKLELDVKLKDVQGLLFGTRNTTNASASAPNYFAFIRYGSGTASNTVGFMCFGKNQQASSVNNLLIGQRFKFVANKNVWTYKRRIGIDYTHTFGSQDAWSNDYAIRIFGHYNGAQYYGAGTIYGIVYSEEDARQHKYVPVRKLADGRCGLYDVADNVSSRYNQVSTSYITPYIDIIPTSTFTNCTTTLLSDAITGTATKAVIGSTWSIKITPSSGYYFVEDETTPVITFDGVDVSSDTSKVTITYNSADNSYTLTILNVPDCAIGIEATAYDIIQFEDNAVKAICVENWGGNVVNGEITKTEAAAVAGLSNKFSTNTTITKFNELEYFTGLTTLYQAFYGCTSLQEVTIPKAPITTMKQMCYNCTALKSISIPNDQTWTFTSDSLSGTFQLCGNLEGTIDLSSVKKRSGNYVDCGNICNGASKITKVIMPRVKVTLNSAFVNCLALVEIDTTGMTMHTSGSTRLTNIIGANSQSRACVNLTTITDGFRGATINLDLGYAPLSHDSALAVVNALGTATATLTLSASARATLSAEEIAIATEKGWSISTKG